MAIEIEQVSEEFTESPLALIKQKEIEINARILQAARESDEKVAEARHEAIEVKARGEKQGKEEAKAVYRNEVAQAKKDAAKIRQGVDQETAKVTKQGHANLEQAIAYIMDLVISASAEEND